MSNWTKLAELGVSTKMVQVIANMYTKARAQVRTAEGLTDSFQCNVGVRKGCPLSPLLFSLFVNDFPDLLSKEEDGVMLSSLKIACLMFADDLDFWLTAPNVCRRISTV